MSTTEERIEALYGPGNSQQEDTSVLRPPDKHTELTDALYPGDQPAEEKQIGNPYALDSGSVEDTLYGGTAQVRLSSATDLSLISKGDPEAEANLTQNLGYIGHEAGANQQDIENIVAAANEHVITGGTQSREEVVQGLHAEYGPQLVSLLADARDLVASFPEVRNWLDSTGAGNDPKIVRQMMKIAQTPRAQKRLATLRRK